MKSLQTEYAAARELASRFCESLTHEIQVFLSTNGVSLGVPIEFRVKSWDSVAEKTSRLSLKLDRITDLNDFVGLRLMLLFRRDVTKVCKLISETFAVVSEEDTSQRLGETEFGYQSLHYIVKLPKAWLSIPSFRGFGDFQAEIQIRTLAQHIWAAGSHILQYKREASVPPPVRRSIYRVSALLETVDLEFERVLEERESYLSDPEVALRDEPLNVDLLAKILDERLPQENKIESEPYSELLEELHHFGMDSTKRLTKLIQEHLDDALAADAEQAKAEGGLPGSKGWTTARGDRLLDAIRTSSFNRGSKFVSACLEHASSWRVHNADVCFLFRKAGSGRFWIDVLNSRENIEAVRAACAEVLGQVVTVRFESDDRWAHVDLVRYMLGAEFGEKWRAYKKGRQGQAP